MLPSPQRLSRLSAITPQANSVFSAGSIPYFKDNRKFSKQQESDNSSLQLNPVSIHKQSSLQNQNSSEIIAINSFTPPDERKSDDPLRVSQKSIQFKLPLQQNTANIQHNTANLLPANLQPIPSVSERNDSHQDVPIFIKQQSY